MFARLEILFEKETQTDKQRVLICWSKSVHQRIANRTDFVWVFISFRYGFSTHLLTLSVRRIRECDIPGRLTAVY